MKNLVFPDLFDPRDHADTCAICFDGECDGASCVDPDELGDIEELQRLVRLGRMVDSIRTAIGATT